MHDKPYCIVAEKWIKAIYERNHIAFDYSMASSNYYSCLEGSTTEEAKEKYEENVKQIKKDLYRTFPDHKAYQMTIKGTTDITQLKNILRAIVKQNPGIGYVQGMNFILGSLFHHSCEAIAFWVFNIMLNAYEVKKLFIKDLVGLRFHSKMLDLLIRVKFPTVWEKMVFYILLLGIIWLIIIA